MNAVALSEIVSFKGGGTPKKDIEAYWGDEIPWATVKDFKGPFLDRTVDSISEVGLKNSSANVYPTGTVLVPTRMAVGKAAINTRDMAVNQDIRALIPKVKLHNKYLYYAILNLAPEIEANSSGATVKGITQKRFEKLKIPLPPLAEQKRIAGILDAADKLRAKRRESIAQLDTLLQSTFIDMFGDPVSNPMGWDVVPFEKIGSSRLGKMLDKGKHKGGQEYPYLANFNVQWGCFVLDELRAMEFSEDDRDEFSLQNDDLLICEGGEVGRTAIWREEVEGVYFQKALHRVRLFKDQVLPQFVQMYMWFMAKNGGFRTFTNSATIAHLTGVKLKSLPVPLPDLKLQKQYELAASAISEQRGVYNDHMEEINILFSSLQQRAFNGTL